MASDRRMTAMDAAFLYLERSGQRLHVASVSTLAGPLDYERLVSDIEGRLHLIPRYTQRAVTVPFGLAHPSWERDPRFDIRNHVIRHRLRAPGSDAQLVDLASRLFAQALDRSRPLWELHQVDNLHGERSALVAKVHHCMIDGISGVQLMGVLFDPSPNPAPPPPPTALDREPAPPLPTPAARVLQALGEGIGDAVATAQTAVGALRDPAAIVARVAEAVDSVSELWRYLVMPVPPTPWNGHVSILRKLAWSTFPLHEVKATKNRLGGTVNDVVLATISGALRAYLLRRGLDPDRMELRAACPVSTRTAAEHLKLGNRVSAMVAPLPVGILDPLERYRQVRVAMAQLKQRGESKHIERMLDLMNLLPPPFQRQLAWMQTQATPVNTICTNVPGPPVTLYVQGVKIDSIAPFVPLSQGIGLGFAILSYADTLTIGLSADPALVPDVAALPELLQAAFEELRQLAGVERAPLRLAPVAPERQRRRDLVPPQVA